MSFGSIVFTNKGKTLQAKVQGGATLRFTKIAMGDGELSGQSTRDLKTLINHKKDIEITSLKNEEGGVVKIGGILSNQSLNQGFYWREIGLFANDPDLGEVLYCYGNASELAEYIPSGESSQLIERRLEIIAIVGDTNVTSVSINNSLIFLTQTDLEAHDNSEAAHGPLRAWVQGLFNSLQLTWGNITGKPSTFPPSSHRHSASEVTGLPTSLPANGGNADTVDGLHANSFLKTDASCNKNWVWVGLGGQPNWLWGGNDGYNMGIYNPSNFSVDNSNKLGGYTFEQIKRICGGDIVGKTMLFESIFTTTTNLVKTYSNPKGGMVRISPKMNHTNNTAFTIVSDGVAVCTNEPITNLMGIIYSNNWDKPSFLDIPFENSFSITANTSGAMNLIYYLNK